MLNIMQQIWTDEERAQSQCGAGLIVEQGWFCSPGPSPIHGCTTECSSLPFSGKVFYLPCKPEGWVCLLICCNPHPYTLCTLQFDSQQQRRILAHCTHIAISSASQYLLVNTCHDPGIQVLGTPKSVKPNPCPQGVHRLVEQIKK